MYNRMMIESYREQFPPGTIIELTASIDDLYSPKPIGSQFHVRFMDDMLQLHGQWLPPQQGGLAVSIMEDAFNVVGYEPW